MSLLKRIWDSLWQHPAQLVWILLAYLPFLGSMSVPFTGDQKVYLGTALEMHQSSSWLHPLLFGEPSYYKPPLHYWATMGGWKLFGFNLWGSLLPSVICVLLTALLLGEISKLLHDRIRFTNAGVWFALALGTITYGTTAQMEIYLCLFYAASWWAGLKFLSKPLEERNWFWLYLAFAIAGLSALVKSPLYPVLWVAGFVSYLVLDGEWELFGQKKSFWAFFIGVVFGSAWFVGMLLTDGSRFWSDYLMRETWHKNSGNSGSILSLWLALLYFSFPFTLIIFPSISSLWSRRRAGNVLRFILCWCWPPALFFSLYPYRVKPYFYLLVPAMAILVEWGYFQVGRSGVFRGLFVLSGVIVLVSLTTIGLVLQKAGFIPLWLLVTFILVGTFAFISSARSWIRGFLFSGMVAVLLFRIAAVQIGEQDIAGLRQLVKARPNDEIAMLDDKRSIWHEVGLLSAAIKKPIHRLSSVEEVTRFVRSGGTVILTDEQTQKFERTIRAKLLGQGDMRDLNEMGWKRWKTRLKFPFKDLLTSKSDQPFKEKLQREFKIISVKQ